MVRMAVDPARNGHVETTDLKKAPPSDEPTKHTWRSAAKARKARLQQAGRESLAAYVRQSRSRRRWVISAMVLVILAYAGAVWYNVATPRHDGSQDAEIAQLKEQIAQLQAPVFPRDAAAGAAHPKVAECFSYSDQLAQDIIAAVKEDCGWNGAGVANLIEIYSDPDPNLIAHVTEGGFSAVPFRIRLANTETVLYYVPVQQTGPTTVKVVGPGSFFMEAPGFIAYDNTEDSGLTAEPNNVFQQAIAQFLAGAERITMPNVTIPVSNTALKPTGATNVTVYEGTSTHHVVSALVTYAGPTLDAQFTVRVAFDMHLSADGDWRIAAVGPDFNKLVA